MKNEYLIMRLKEIERNIIDGLTNETTQRIEELLQQLRREEQEKQESKDGRKEALAGAKELLKSGGKTREMLGYAYTDPKNGKQVVSNICALVVFAEPIKSLPELPEDMRYFNYEQCIPHDNKRRVELPHIAELKEHISAGKAELKRSGKPTKGAVIEYALKAEDITVYVNAERLLSVLKCMGDCECYAGRSITPLYFRNANGDEASLCPLQHATNQ